MKLTSLDVSATSICLHEGNWRLPRRLEKSLSLWARVSEQPKHNPLINPSFMLAPTKSPTITLEEYVTYATLRWNLPSGYEAIASSGGVWYTITVENMATGQKRTITAVNTTRSYDMTQSTEYCFTVRAEVSGGSGEYSEKKCITTQGMTNCSSCHL